MANGDSSSSDLLVIFGISGDLARKMTFRALYRLESRDLLDCPIVGVASAAMAKEKLVERARQAICESGEKIDDACSTGWRPGCLTCMVTSPMPSSTASLPSRSARTAIRCTTWKCRRRCSRRLSKTSRRPTCWSAHAWPNRRPSGDRQLFAREDAIEETWRIGQPLLDKPSRIRRYDRGPWGPEAAVSLLHGRRAWQEPWPPKHTPATQ